MTVRDDTRIPPLSLLLGFGPVLLLPLLGLLAWVLPPRPELIMLALGQLWGSAILIFLAGVRRGLSFFTEGGPRPIQLATMLWLFVLGLGALLSPAVWAFALLLVGYGSVALLDPRAAPRGEVPAYFARLRPPQMAMAMLGLVALMARAAALS